MSQLHISISHKKSKEEALSCIKDLLKRVKKEHGDKVSDLTESWKGNTGTFRFKARGYAISGTLEVKDKEVELLGELPWALGLFKSKIEKMIRSEAEKCLKS